MTPLPATGARDQPPIAHLDRARSCGRTLLSETSCDLSAATTATLDDLYLDMELEHHVGDPLAPLHRELEFAVPSYRGLRQVLISHHKPIICTSFALEMRREDIKPPCSCPVPAGSRTQPSPG